MSFILKDICELLNFYKIYTDPVIIIILQFPTTPLWLLFFEGV